MPPYELRHGVVDWLRLVFAGGLHVDGAGLVDTSGQWSPFFSSKIFNCSINSVV